MKKKQIEAKFLSLETFFEIAFLYKASMWMSEKLHMIVYLYT